MRADQAARYGRQILLEGVGEPGQERVLAATAEVDGEGFGHRVARRYAERAGFASVQPGPLPEAPADLLHHEAPTQLLAGSRAALRSFVKAVNDDG